MVDVDVDVGGDGCAVIFVDVRGAWFGLALLSMWLT